MKEFFKRHRKMAITGIDFLVGSYFIAMAFKYAENSNDVRTVNKYFLFWGVVMFLFVIFRYVSLHRNKRKS